ncbi:MAG TPA: homoserine dehydrogenase, partial [Lachnospiraceae bacterium]|nr:homoserine dehydrogenase [Lachnospiraceae bacterium]
MRVAILGYGTIGRGVYEIISQKATTYTSRMSVSYIWIRKGKEKVLPEMCDDFNKILADKEVEVVVEVLGGLEPARTMILEALRAKKHVVTANKKVVAAHLQEFLQVAKENEVQFLFEASTGGGIPWIRSVEKVKRIDEVSDFHGIFNGTTNYILDRMYKEGAEFDEVLKQAQQLGYAEHDPSADIDGIDIGNKL